MRRYPGLSIAASIAALLVALAPATTAAATTDVLTAGSVGGTNVAVGDSLLASGPVSFCTSTQGTSCVKCNVSFGVVVDTNPPAPGTATFTVESMTFSSVTCTSTIQGTGLQSFSVKLPLSGSVNDAGGVVVDGPVQVMFTFTTILGHITCAYQSTGNLMGMFSNSTNAVTFTNQQFNKTSGPAQCPATLFGSATLTVTDSTLGGQPVFVN